MRSARASSALGDHHIIARAIAAEFDIDGAEVGLGRQAVSDDAALGQLRDHRLHHRMVDAERGETVERNVGDETLEGLAAALSKSP